VAFIVVGLMGGGAYAYTTYQDPENALLDAASKALGAKQVHTKTTVTSDFAYTSGGTSIKFGKLIFESGMERTPKIDENAELSITYNGKDVTLKATVLATDAGELYFRVDNAKDTLQKVLGNDLKMSAKAESYLANIDGKWAKYTLDELKKDNPDSGKTVQCTLDTYKKYKDDKKAIQELVDLYKKNQFVVVEGDPITKDGNVGYIIGTDSAKLKSYVKASADTAMTKELDACSGVKSSVKADYIREQAAPADPNADNEKTVTTAWVSQWGHELRAIDTVTSNLRGIDQKKFTVTTHTEFDFTKGVTTSAPTDTMKFKDWTDNAMKIYGEISGVDVAGLEARDQNDAAKPYASVVVMKAEAYNVNIGSYPQSIADFDTLVDSRLSELYPSMVVASLPQDQEHIAYKKCTTDTGAQVVYKKSNGTFVAYNVGRIGGPEQVVTSLCK
jgi:hypothetical protein